MNFRCDHCGTWIRPDQKHWTYPPTADQLQTYMAAAMLVESVRGTQGERGNWLRQTGMPREWLIVFCPACHELVKRKEEPRMATARVELYKDGDHMAIATDANDEHAFWESFCELLGNLISDDVLAGFNTDGEPNTGMNYGGDWEFQLRYWLPQATEIVCRLRGYKALDVREERRLIAGWGGVPTHKVHEIGGAELVLSANGGVQAREDA